VVSQAIVAQMQKTRAPNVFLDVSHLDPTYVKQRFPGIARTCAEFGIDIAIDPIPVRPGAHYMIGGVSVDLDGRSTVDRLWAAGEVSSSLLHGANRLASNSLLEGLVYGARAGRGASAAALEQADSFQAVPLENPPLAPPNEPFDLADARNSLKSLMWRAVGVRREGTQLAETLQTIRNWCRYALGRQFTDPEGWELQNMLTVASLMVDAALEREETRGVHLRTDFPATDDAHWRRNLTVVRPPDNDENR
jgi:L-aspartate oxidase